MPNRNKICYHYQRRFKSKAICDFSSSAWLLLFEHACLCFFNTQRTNFCSLYCNYAEISYSSNMYPSKASYNFQFRVVLLLYWLPTMAREFSLFCYLIRSWREEMDPYLPKCICAKMNVTNSVSRFLVPSRYHHTTFTSTFQHINDK